MKPQIKYIELKTGYNDNGPAWIGLASFSKTGNTVYFNGTALKKGQGIAGNHFDIETGEEYWISGVKKEMTDRHWAGGGTVYVVQNALDEYLKIIGKTSIDNRNYTIIDSVTETSAKDFYEVENEIAQHNIGRELTFKKPEDLTTTELEHVITELMEEEQQVKYNKVRRSFKARRLEFEAELERRLT